MTMKKTQSDGDAETTIKGISPDVAGKRDYVEPTLMIFGTVRGLTATGTGKDKEVGNVGGMSNPNDPQKHP